MLGISCSVFSSSKFLCITLEWHWFLYEQKTKPTQHSVRGLRSLGLTPDILACRSTMVFSSSYFIYSPPLHQKIQYKKSYTLFVPSAKELLCPIGTWWNRQGKALSFLPCSGTMSRIAMQYFIQCNLYADQNLSIEVNINIFLPSRERTSSPSTMFPTSGMYHCFWEYVHRTFTWMFSWFEFHSLLTYVLLSFHSGSEGSWGNSKSLKPQWVCLSTIIFLI